MRNNLNRLNNFETANIGKTASAAARQLLAIEKFRRPSASALCRKICGKLPCFAGKNPELSLRELGDMLSSPLSRSGVNHRLQRIVELSERQS